MKMHPRYGLVAKARKEVADACDALYAAGTIIERMCVDICEVERACLFASQYDVIPGGPETTAGAKLWEVVQAKVAEHGLTWGEAARIVHHLSNYWLNVIVRVERHGPQSDGKKADEA